MEVETARPVAQARPLPAAQTEVPPRSGAWRSADILRAGALVLGLYLLLRLLWVAYPLLFLSFLGMLFGLAVASGTDHLERLRIPRGIGATLIVLAVLGIVTGLIALAAPRLQAQAGELQQAIPQAVDKVETWVRGHQDGFIGKMIPLDTGKPTGRAPAPVGAQNNPQNSPATPPDTPPAQAENPSAGRISRLPDSLSGQLGAVSRYLFSFLSSTVAVLAGIVLLLFLSIYIGASPDLYRRGLLHMVPRRGRAKADEVLTAIAMTLRRWLLSQLVAMVVIGVVIYVVLSLLHVRAALALGILAGLFEFIPMLGPILSGAPAVAMGLLDSPQKALFVLIAYVAVQFFENHILIPMLMKEGVDLPPVVTLIGLALMSLIFGFLGMLVAVPFLAAVMVAVKLLYVNDVVGDEVETVLDA
jgi:predicted PurR-regulated permease PerM